MADTKPSKTLKTFHTSNSKMGSGDSYGSGVKNKVGSIRSSVSTPSAPKKKLSKLPKSLA